MALQWVAVATVSAFEAALLLLVSLPLPRALAAIVVPAVTAMLQPLLAAVPFCAFALLDVYWKYEHNMECKGGACTSADRDRFQKSMMKSQRNLVVGLMGIFLYWVLYRVCKLVSKIQALEKLVAKDGGGKVAVREDKGAKGIKEQ